MSRAFLLIAMSCLIAGYAEGGDAPWQHSPSPYRAVFETTSHPSWRNSGYFIEVPISGLGDADGQGVYAFDDRHRPMKLLAIGPTTGNRALVLVGRDAETSRIYAYWGSPRRAPQNQMMEHGLVLAVREMPKDLDTTSWARSRDTIDKAKISGVQPLETLSVAGNPFGNESAIIYDIQGWLQNERVAQLSLFLANTGRAFLLIDGQPVLERLRPVNINALRQATERHDVTLRQGLTPFRCVVISPGERTVAALGRFETERKKYVLPADAYVRSGATKLQVVQGQYANTVVPAFRSVQPSYLGIESFTYTEVELETYTKQIVQWRLGNGAHGEGPSLRTIHVGLEPLTVEAGQARRREQASGSIHFVGVPRQFQWQNQAHYRHYATIMLEQPLKDLDPATLAGYLFFMQLHERNADAVPVAQAMLEQRQARQTITAEELHLTMARGAAATHPDLAHEAYNQLLRLTKDPAIIHEYIEFLLYRLGDIKTARETIERAERLSGRQDRQLTLYSAELAMLEGKADDARAAILALQSFVTERRMLHSLTVQANAAIERFRDHLQGGFYTLAEADLRELPLSAPRTLLDGQYALLRSQWFRRIGWPESAVSLIRATIELNSLPAFLPDLELQKAHALRELARLGEARQAYEHIIKTFPNHPAAAIARQQLANLPETPATP